MFGTIENTNYKINEKISYVRQSIAILHDLYNSLRGACDGKNVKLSNILDKLLIAQTVSDLEQIEINYNLCIVGILSDYYSNVRNENRKTQNYYRVIISENFIAKINDIISRVKYFISIINKILKPKLFPHAEYLRLEKNINSTSKLIDQAHQMQINLIVEKRNYEICKCGNRMIVIPELSELHCPKCFKIKTIIGAVFRDDQFYPQDGQKTKHGGYDTSRHYRFWIERLQALENKTFDDDDLKRIEYVLMRDGYDCGTLSCEQMREILKDPKVAATSLNDHAPLLVKMFGGPPPPRLSFQENRMIAILFNKAMRLYDIVNPDGGNKPYYPYFIYKIIEHEFRNNHEKLRLLDYIHLQSRETVIKNDKFYEQMCACDNGLVYCATDPAGRL